MRYIKLLLIFILTILLSGCIINDPKYINFKSKPNDYYYSNEIYSKVKKNEIFKLQVFDADLYKYYDVADADYDIILNFFSALKSKNYLTELNSEDKPPYELIITFNDAKYVINVYSNTEASVYPWDGCFKEDIVDMTGVCNHDNLYYFCQYVIEESQKQSASQ